MFYLHLFLNLVSIVLICVSAYIDQKSMRLPDKLTIPLLVVGLLNASLSGKWSFLTSILAAQIIGGLFMLTWVIYPKGMGMGDIKFAAALASFLGFPGILIALFIACIAGAIGGGVLMFKKSISVKEQIPFGPYLAVGSLVALLFFFPHN